MAADWSPRKPPADITKTTPYQIIWRFAHDNSELQHNLHNKGKFTTLYNVHRYV